MKHFATLLISLSLASCANAPREQQPDYLFRDAAFTAPAERISAADVFAINADMKRYLEVTIAKDLRAKGAQQGLIDALYNSNQLKIDYDSGKTRTATETFADRAGNCLSLVIMTAAFARELGLPIRFQGVVINETWSRSGDMYVAAGHVNMTVGQRTHDIKSRIDANMLITIDFNRPDGNRSNNTWAITEQTILAMYMNNRAAEALALGKVNDAYWWAREAIKQEASFLSAYNTLGVVYRRHGNLAEAEQVLNYVIAQESGNTQAMSNLVRVYGDQGRQIEAKEMQARLDQRQPFPPYHFFDLGRTAMLAGDYKTAKELFAKEVQRDEFNHEFHFWLASAYYRLGNFTRSAKHLAVAKDFSPTRTQFDLYVSKLDRLKTYQ